MLAMLFFAFLLIVALKMFNKLVVLITHIINMPRKLMIARARAQRNARSMAVIAEQEESVVEVVTYEVSTETSVSSPLDRDSKICLGQFPNQEDIDWSEFDTPSYVRHPARQHCLSW